MKKLIALIALLNILLLPQTDKKELLEELKNRGDIEVTGEGNDIYRIEYPGGVTQYYYLGKTETLLTDSIPTTVIETWTIDTMLYKDMYYFWQEVPVATSTGYELIIGDANKNGLPEIYGYTKDYYTLPVWANIFEMDSSGSFSLKYVFPDSVGVSNGLYDIAHNGELKLLTRGRVSGYSLFYKSDSISFLPTQLDIIFSSYPGQLDNPKFGDFNKNGVTDFLFYDFQGARIVLCEYNPIANNFDPVAEIPDPSNYSQGFSIGDFDLDNKTDIVYGNWRGEVFMIENEDENTYLPVWKTEVELNNVYMHLATNDIDKNGKPEFWVSSTTFYGYTDVTRFTCFEYTGDNEYEEVCRIDFVGVFPIYAGNAFARDVDKDGTEELVICISVYVFIMQFAGSSENPYYEIFYMSRNNIPGGYTGITMYDIDNDKTEELLIHRGTSLPNGYTKEVTHLFKPNFIVSAANTIVSELSGFELEQVYPNPFNPGTNIAYTIPVRSQVSLKVYDVLGNEITTLEEGEKLEGRYTVQWNGKDKYQREVNSGIYFIHLATPYYKKTVKGVMLK